MYSCSSANIFVFYPIARKMFWCSLQFFGKLENSAMDSGQQQYTTFSNLLLKKQFNGHVISF